MFDAEVSSLVLCIAVPLPPGTYPLAVNNNNNNNNNNNRKYLEQKHCTFLD
jgi:hypothetical protein